MTRLTWGAPGERRFETGVDRGVLYFDNTAHAWNGLISVEESPQGGSAQGYYYDGVKYASLIGPEEFQASVTAVTVPEVFDEIDGRKAIAPGFYAGEQPRRAFDFIYRSKIGSDTKGVDAGYKIHIIYNALAEATSKTYTTMSDQTAPMEVSWTLTTMPPKAAGYKPTAHFVIDATKMEQSLVSVLEGILYGGEGVTPRLPQPQELLNMFGSWISIEPDLPIVFLGKKVRTIKLVENMIANPTFSRVNPTSTSNQVERTNLFTNPTAMDGEQWTASNGVGSTHSGSGLPYGLPDTFRRVTANSSSPTGFYSVVGTSVMLPGKTYTISRYVRSSSRRTIRIGCDFSKNGVPLPTQSGEPVTLMPGVWTRAHGVVTVPIGATAANPVGYAGLVSGYPGGAGDTIDQTGQLIELGNQLYPYFDGTNCALYGASVSWLGALRKSQSKFTAGGVGLWWDLGFNPSFEIPGVEYNYKINRALNPRVNIGNEWEAAGSATPGATGSRVTMVSGLEDLGISAAFRAKANGSVAWLRARNNRMIPITPGENIPISMYVRSSKAQQVRLHSFWYNGMTYVSEIGNTNVSIPAMTWTRLEGTITAPASGIDGLRVSIMTSGSQAVALDDYIDVVALLVGESGPYFDGEYSPDPDFKPMYEGDPTTTRSILKGMMPRNVAHGGGRWVTQSEAVSYSGSKSIRILRDGVPANAQNGAVVYTFSESQLNKVYTAVARLYIPQGYNASEDFDNNNGVSRGIHLLSNMTGGKAQGPSTPGWHLVRAFLTPTSVNQTIRLGGGGLMGQYLYWDDFTLVEGEHQGLMPFNSEMSPDPDFYPFVYDGQGRCALVGIQSAGTTSQGNVSATIVSENHADIGQFTVRVVSLMGSSANTWGAPWHSTNLTVGKTYRFRVRCWIDKTLTLAGGAIKPEGIRVVAMNQTWNNIGSTPPTPNTPGMYDLDLTFTVPSGVTTVYIRMTVGTNSGGGDAWWDQAILTEGPEYYPYFDGDSNVVIDKIVTSPTWSGTQHASKPTAEIITSLPSNPQLGEAWDISGTLYVWDGSVWTPYPMSTIPY